MLHPVTSSPTKRVWNPAPRRRTPIALACVALAHVLLIVALVSLRREPVERPISSRPVTVTLLSAAPQPVAKPAALESKRPTPKPPIRQVERRPPPLPIPHPDNPPAPVATATPAPAPTPPAPAPAVPAIARPTLAVEAPKDVSHLDCNIAKPDYPYLSQRRGETGTAVVRFVVGLTGSIESIALKQSSGFPKLDSAALDAMRASKCQPYKENGEAIRATYSQPFVFNLDD